MKGGAATMTTAVLALITLTALFSTGAACDNVPSMTKDEACRKASYSQQLHRLCRTTLKHAQPRGEVRVYALAAGKAAKQSYEPALETAARLLDNSSLGDVERQVYTDCKRKYAEARMLMADILDRLFYCNFAEVRQEYVDATVAVTSCGNGLAKFVKSSPLYAMNLADQDKTMLAYEIGVLIVGK